MIWELRYITSLLVTWSEGFTATLTTSHIIQDIRISPLFWGREGRQHNEGTASRGIKGGHLSHWCFQEYFFFLSLSPTLFCLVFCNFNLAAKYSCSVLSVTASQSPGLSRCVTRTSYSLYLSLSVSLCFPQSDSLFLCAYKGLEEVLTALFHVMSLSCENSMCIFKYTAYSICCIVKITSKRRLERSLC